MDKTWLEQVLSTMGPRYKMGALVGDGVEVLYRAGRSDFRPSRFVIGGGAVGHDLELSVDVRIPRDGSTADAELLIKTFEEKSTTPRNFVRFDDQVAQMTSEGGANSGSARTLKYRKTSVASETAAREIRAFVESIDIPIVVGIHEAEHVVVRDAPPLRERMRREVAQLEDWEYALDSGAMRSLTLVVNPNERTLRVMERKLFSKQQLGETLKLAQVAKFAMRQHDGRTEIVAIKKEGEEVIVAAGSGNSNFVATAGRFAKKVMIPLVAG